jgi:hypothetical protein
VVAPHVTKPPSRRLQQFKGRLGIESERFGDGAADHCGLASK